MFEASFSALSHVGLRLNLGWTLGGSCLYPLSLLHGLVSDVVTVGWLYSLWKAKAFIMRFSLKHVSTLTTFTSSAFPCSFLPASPCHLPSSSSFYFPKLCVCVWIKYMFHIWEKICSSCPSESGVFPFKSVIYMALCIFLQLIPFRSHVWAMFSSHPLMGI